MLDLITTPTETLTSVAELKEERIIEHTNDDARLLRLLEDATAQVETDCNLCFMSQVWRETLPCFPRVWRLKKAPVQSVVVKYYDADNVLQTLDQADYYFVKGYIMAKLYPVDSWPSTYHRPDAVQVDMTCGFTAIPNEAIRACLLLCGGWDEFREAEVMGSTNETKLGYERLIRSLRRGYVGG